MKAKSLYYLLLIPVLALLVTSCEKDEDGNYLSPTYCTVSYGGINYIDRAKSALPGFFPGIPSPDSRLITETSTDISDNGILPILYIDTWLKPADETLQQCIFLNIFLRNVEPGKSLVGREFTISSSDAFTRDNTSEALSIIARDKIDIVAMFYHPESIYSPGTYISCTGTLRITEYNEKNNCISGDFSLTADGQPLKGNFYKISLATQY